MTKQMTNVEKLEKKIAFQEKKIERAIKKVGDLIDVNTFVAIATELVNTTKYAECYKILKKMGYEGPFGDYYYDACDICDALEDKDSYNRQMEDAIAKDQRKADREEKKAMKAKIIEGVNCKAIDTFLKDWKIGFIEWAKSNENYKYESDARIEEIATAEVEAKKFDLISRITEKAGIIVDATYLTIGMNGSLNGRVIGEKKTVNVETIFAGGYNIQRLHYRVLVN